MYENQFIHHVNRKKDKNLNDQIAITDVEKIKHNLTSFHDRQKIQQTRNRCECLQVDKGHLQKTNT